MEEYRHPEVRDLASHVFAQGLVLRAIMVHAPEQLRHQVREFIDMWEGLMLYEPIGERHPKAIAAQARKIIDPEG